jgi:hypothetical protein
MLKMKHKITLGAALIAVLLMAGIAFGEASSMNTFIRTSGGVNPAAGTITFTAYYNSDDSKIHSEDSWNDTNNNEGYVSTSGACRVNPMQMAGEQSSQSYNIWISYNNGAEGGTTSGTIPTSGTGYTNPGTTTNRLNLTSGYLATPSGFGGAAGNGEAFIKWDSAAGATGYRVYRRPAAGEGATEIVFERAGVVSSGSQTGLVVTGLANGTTYRFIMVATDSSRRSGHPNEISLTPTSTGVPNVTGPSSGTVGSAITITGTGFGLTTGQVYIRGVAAAITSWSDASINATIASSTPIGAGKLVVVTSGSLEDSIDFTVNDIIPTGNKDFALIYLSETQAENWLSVPFNSPQVSGTSINTIGDLMNSLGGAFTAQTGDIMTMSWYDNISQTPYFALRDYSGSSWNSWDPGMEALPLVTGKMYIFSLSNPGRPTFSQTWRVSGLVPPTGTVTFPLSYLSETQAENWISVPNQPSITNNGNLMNSLGGAFTPQAGDIMTLSWYDNTAQTPYFALRDYNGSSWNSWDPGMEALTTGLGNTYKFSISNPGRPTFTVSWP